MHHRKKLHKKIKSKLRIRYQDMEKLLLLYGFEIDKSSGGAHWIVRNTEVLDENGNPKYFPVWRPHGRKENFLSPKTKKRYLEYIDKVEKKVIDV